MLLVWKVFSFYHKQRSKDPITGNLNSRHILCHSSIQNTFPPSAGCDYIYIFIFAIVLGDKLALIFELPEFPTSFYPSLSRLVIYHRIGHLSPELVSEVLLQSLGVSSELGDTLAELLDGHLVLVEVEAEVGLVVNVALLLDVEGGGLVSVKLLGDSLLGFDKLLEEVRLENQC